MREILQELAAFSGRVSLYYRTLDGSDSAEFRADERLVAASVIKIPVMVEAFYQMAEGKLCAREEVSVRAQDKLPSCGALSYLHDGLRVEILDLITLMIILSDNTATNLLIDRLGMDAINARLEKLGIPGVRMERRLFDDAASARGLQNRITARGIGTLLEKLYRGEIVSKEASEKMLEILKNQQLNGKFPFYLKDVEMAHKTGEDDGITHDAGIVYAKRPFVLCMFANEVDAPRFERVMQHAAKRLYEKNQGE